jgi:hypothetical protein
MLIFSFIVLLHPEQAAQRLGELPLIWWACWVPGGIVGIAAAALRRALIGKGEPKLIGCSKHRALALRSPLMLAPPQPPFAGWNQDSILLMTLWGMPSMVVIIMIGCLMLIRLSH